MIPGPIAFNMYQAMKSAFPDVGVKLYEKLPGREGKTWIIEDGRKNPEAIYCDNPRDRTGFGGAEFEFTLADGSVFKSKGPWKSGSEGLLEETGVDLTKLHLTRGIVALRREPGSYGQADIYFDVLHVDEVPVVGLFNRIDFLAQTLANELGREVCWSTVSNGGGCASRTSPGPLSDQHVTAVVKDALLALDLPDAHIEKMLSTLRDVRAAERKAARR
jgi:hypothetical protein